MAKATLNGEYATRICGVGAVMLALAAWSVYDGAVAWPRANGDLAAVRETLVESSATGGMAPELWLATNDGGSFPLKEVFEGAGRRLPRALVVSLGEITSPAGDGVEERRARAAAAAELFKREIYPDGKRRGQFVQAAVLAVLALLAFRAVWSKRGVEYVADDAGLSGSGFGGATIPWDDVKSVDWSRWREKGIVALTTARGVRHTLDGWHFRGVRDIAAEIARRHPEPSQGE